MLAGPENKTEINNVAEQVEARPPRFERALKVAAVLGAAALLAADYQTSGPANPSVALGTVSAEARQISDNSLAQPIPEDKKCKKRTSIRSNANYIYKGIACAEDGDSYQRISGIPSKQGWVYSVVRISMKGKDISKCGYVRPKVLPVRPARPRSVTHCRKYFGNLVLRNDVFFDKYNCKNVSRAFDACRDGTYFSPVADSCPDPVTYANFESDDPSPTNVFGTGQGSFRDPIPANKKTSVRYRTEFNKPTSSGIKAIVVRAPKWGFIHTKCVADEHRDGGTLK